jgi:hypothetical protein
MTIDPGFEGLRADDPYVGCTNRWWFDDPFHQIACAPDRVDLELKQNERQA